MQMNYLLAEVAYSIVSCDNVHQDVCLVLQLLFG